MTVAPGTTPWASATVPVTVPVVICAEADHAKANTSPNATVRLLTVFVLDILPPPHIVYPTGTPGAPSPRRPSSRDEAARGATAFQLSTRRDPGPPRWSCE